MPWLLLYPFYFSWAAFFPLHLKLIIRLLLCHSSVPSHLLPASIEKTGMFCKGTKAGWHYLAGVYYYVAPLLKNNPEKFHFGIKNPLDLWHLMRLAYLLRHTGLILYRLWLISRKKIYDTSFLNSHFLKILIIKKLRTYMSSNSFISSQIAPNFSNAIWFVFNLLGLKNLCQLWKYVLLSKR